MEGCPPSERPAIGVLRLRFSASLFARTDLSSSLLEKDEAEAPSSELLALERWDEAGHRRLLLVNFGEAVRFNESEQAWLGESRGLYWRPLLSTAEPRFAGPGGELAALRPGDAIDVPARCAVLWAAEQEA